MALKTFNKAKAKSATASAWTPEGKPAEADDLTIPSGDECIVNSSPLPCTSLKSEGTMTSEGSTGIHVGSSAEPLEGRPAVELDGAGWKYAAEIQLLSTFKTAVQKLKLGAATLTQALRLTAACTATYKLEQKLGITGLMGVIIEGGKLETNGQEVTVPLFNVQAAGSADITGSLLVLSSAEGTPYNATGTVTGTASATVEMTDAGKTQKTFNGSGYEGTLVAIGNYILVIDANKFSVLKVSNKRKPKTCKATLIEGSTAFITSEETDLAAEVEVSGKGIPIGTTLVKKIKAGEWEMSTKATETIGVAEEITIFPAGLILKATEEQTVTTFECNGTPTEPSRIASSKAGEQGKLKLPAKNLELTATVRVRDLAVTRGDLYLPNGVNLGGNNEHVHFEAEPAASADNVAMIV